jgi:ABC-type Fe3+/spermidine/putrescine transport system ATPase subunit
VNRIVADFMGNVNLLPATVVSAQYGKGSVLIGGELRLDAELSDGMTVNSEIDVAIRPENILLGPAVANGHAKATAKVSERTFLGNFNEYIVTLASGQALRVQTHPNNQFAVGDSVGIAVDASQISLFPRNANARINQ